MRVLLLSRYADRGASSRVRFFQYLDYFEAQNWTVKVSPLFSNAYLDALYTGEGRVLHTVRGYLQRVYALTRARQFDVLVVEKELFPFLPAWFEQLLVHLSVPYVVDYDDALFHRYDDHSRALVRRVLGRKIDAVMRNAAVVIAGNEYLAERARVAGARRVEVIPTVVDTDRYRPTAMKLNGPLVVGWIGTPKTSHYLRPLLPVFDSLKQDIPVRFVAVGARPIDFSGTPVETRAWSEETEVELIQEFDIGIMPLDDSPWERGKCGYKLIQCMACGLPVVASPVGVNREIVVSGENGLLAATREEWSSALRKLLEVDSSVREAMGRMGRDRAERWYSLKVQAPRFLAAVRRVCL